MDELKSKYKKKLEEMQSLSNHNYVVLMEAGTIENNPYLYGAYRASLASLNLLKEIVKDLGD